MPSGKRVVFTVCNISDLLSVSILYQIGHICTRLNRTYLSCLLCIFVYICIFAHRMLFSKHISGWFDYKMERCSANKI